jgi:hypothetical protein
LLEDKKVRLCWKICWEYFLKVNQTGLGEFFKSRKIFQNSQTELGEILKNLGYAERVFKLNKTVQR